jgi:aldehyde dehydrogenase (NAD+)
MDQYNINQMLEELGIRPINNGLHTGVKWIETNGELIESYSPTDGKLIAKVKQATWDDYEALVSRAQEAFLYWRLVPAPKRGEIVRQIGQELRKYKEPLGKLVSYEMGKVYQEGLGEVQEMIDIADFAVGQSRQLYGFTMHSEREMHRMYEQYHPLGIVGVISAFNFPVAVWSWNAMIALIAGDVVIWKPSSKTMLCAIATHNIIQKVLHDNNLPDGILNLVASSSKYVGDDFLADRRIPLISITGSTRVGRKVNQIVGARLGKTILELGGNNAIIISQNGNLDMALIASMFGATATAGQRCTSTRRLIIHEDVYDVFKEKLIRAYKLHNSVPQGLSSAIFSTNIHETELFLSHAGSDCGIANVNIATNGAEIGGAFGGEKDTGGGRESGSDAWKAYMRRQTNTINFGKELPLAQGIKFTLFD